MPSFAVRPPGDDPFDSADPFYSSFSVTSTRPAAEVWAAVNGADGTRPLAWCTGLRGIDWTSPEPRGVGTTRTVVLSNRVRLDERYFQWDEDPATGYVNAFTGVATTVPLFRRMVERYTVVPEGEGSRFTWEFVIEPSAPGPAKRLAQRLVDRDLAGLRRDTIAHFAER